MPTRLSAATAFARIRKLCLALPGTSERVSHGAPTFFAGKGSKQRSFLMCLDNHHDDGRLAIWCAATPEAQRALVTERPEQFFVPPYVGTRGWLGVRLDRKVEWDQVGQIVEDAFLLVARP